MKYLLFVIIMALSSNIYSQPLKIAHAAGGINGQHYTNSIEALTSNYAKGFRSFEIDFSWTSDDKLVCLHDWKKKFKNVFGHRAWKALSYQQFQQLLDSTDGLHPCTPFTLNAWLKQHSDAKIITDVKHKNIKAIKRMINQYPALMEHFIPQFYQPEEYALLKDMGFNKLIWILYQYKGRLSSVPSIVKNMDLLAISMRASQAKKKFAKKLIANGERVFVYTVNNQKKLDKLVNKYHVSGIYTDFLDSTHSESGL